MVGPSSLGLAIVSQAEGGGRGDRQTIADDAERDGCGWPAVADIYRMFSKKGIARIPGRPGDQVPGPKEPRPRFRKSVRRWPFPGFRVAGGPRRSPSTRCSP